MLKCRNCGFIFAPSINKEYIERVVEHYERRDPFLRVAKSRKFLYQRFLSEIDKRFAKKIRILDVGCGPGFFLSLARQKGWDCYGVEVVSSLCEMARRRYKLNNIINSRFEDIEFPDYYFDIITLWNVLDEIDAFKEVIIKVKRMLKEDGLLFIRTPNATFHSFFCRLHNFNLAPRRIFILHIRNFSKKSIQILLGKVGFSQVRVRNSSPTAGDPYGGKKGVKIYKFFAFLIAQLLFILSFGRVTLAPSIEVFAENGKN